MVILKWTRDERRLYPKHYDIIKHTWAKLRALGGIKLLAKDGNNIIDINEGMIVKCILHESLNPAMQQV